jgi:hypothetical protein
MFCCGMIQCSKDNTKCLIRNFTRDSKCEYAKGSNS